MLGETMSGEKQPLQARSRCQLAIAVFGIALTLLASLGTALAADPLETQRDSTETDARDWGLAVTPYVLFGAQSTDVAGQQIRRSFNDLASLANFGFMGRVTARYKWLLFVADGAYADLESAQDIGRTHVGLNVAQNILDLKLMGKVFDNRSPEQDKGVGIWAGAGARYWNNDIDVLVVRQPILPSGDEERDQVTGSQSWWDPVLGVSTHFPVTQTVGFSVRATAGGFGIGSASTFMWDGEFAALFRLSKRLLLSAGYRRFMYTRTEGEGADETKTEVSVNGPTIGLSIGIF